MKKFFVFFFVLLALTLSFANINVRFYDTKLEDALKILENISGSTILTTANLYGNTNKIINTTDIELALDILLYGTNFEYRKINQNLYVVGDFNRSIETMQKSSTRIKIENIDKYKISNVLMLISDRINIMPNSDEILVHGQDELQFSIVTLIQYLKNNVGKENQIIVVSQHEISSNFYEYLKIIEKNQEVLELKSKDSIGFLESNFDILTTLNKIEFFEISEDTVYLKDFNVEIKEVQKDKLKITVNTLKNQNSKDLELISVENNYLLFENQDKYYIIALSYLNLDTLKVINNNQNNTFSFSVGLDYSLKDLLFGIHCATAFNKNYLSFSYNFFEFYQILYYFQLIENFKIGISFKTMNENVVSSIILSDTQDFETFLLNGELYINSLNGELSSSFFNMQSMSYDLFIIKNYFLNDNNTQKVTIAPGTSLEVNKEKEANLYFNLNIAYEIDLTRAILTFKYQYYRKNNNFSVFLSF
ncbi:hypothetical protein [Petrotoga sp. 9PWA.NaAc.5.4]|uniref:hypothetical protein n=1 Tax=Petrotoga sp. 9PWA.NaAc.5.4 TaxID=1434328 RepID=UPI000CC85A38|nr:hypothetical protein [Petrotoga sp. 9PWA.NaAc.5.4]PNR92569.1 hypothetical protein X924_09535 [Petrotoga sp. 9PWA.NaAc.5.4]